MHLFICRLVALFGLVFIASPAFAKKGFGLAGFGDQLMFVKELPAETPNGSKLSVCVKAHRAHVFFLNVYRVPEKYVLAKDMCGGDQFYNVPDHVLKPMLELARLPAEPRFTAGEYVTSFLGSILLVPALLIGLLRKRNAAEDSPQSYGAHAMDMAPQPARPTQPQLAQAMRAGRLPNGAPVFGRRQQ